MSKNGLFSYKYPSGVKADPAIVKNLKKKLNANSVSCMHGFKISSDMNVSPQEIGKTIDLIDARISECQLGLFGYGTKKKIIKPAKEINSSIENAIKQKISENVISCLSIWELSKTEGVSKMQVASICEALNIKIKYCQLGAF